jgi:hypothetical protein
MEPHGFEIVWCATSCLSKQCDHEQAHEVRTYGFGRIIRHGSGSLQFELCGGSCGLSVAARIRV